MILPTMDGSMDQNVTVGAVGNKADWVWTEKQSFNTSNPIVIHICKPV